MPRKKLTRRKLKALIRDEQSATKEYAKLGFKSLSKDEGRHAKFLTRIAKSQSVKYHRKAHPITITNNYIGAEEI
jgi:hypothetical protein